MEVLPWIKLLVNSFLKWVHYWCSCTERKSTFCREKGTSMTYLCLKIRTEVSMLSVTDFAGPPESRVADAVYVRSCEGQYVLHWEPFDGKAQ